MSGEGNGGRGGDLGGALRHWRERLDPATVGLPAGRNRRTAGLRREELAMLAGMSADYVIRLEQGRATSPSPQILTALARALRLSEAELRHLFVLAGRTPPTSARMPTHLTPGVQRLLDQMSATPVGVYDAVWTLIAWNRMYAALHGDPSALAGRERNCVWRHFTGMPGRVAHTPEQEARFEAATVADLRAATVRYPGDPGPRSLVRELRRVSERFAGLWDSHTVGTHMMHTKTVRHPEVGTLALDCDVLTVPGSDLHVTIYTAAPGTEAADKLGLLGVIGTQAMS
ncbi:helix-turn-helix domain-containing protein [Streptomyces sp. NA02950]|uniref:helix-turn-helix transcriptional regulator n=1 Tax=Streptomyces sp. NA02950 TaxID=2742137 RepID=UPI001592856A|nr:helix-turn-helix transcriptional regulator [Streptomyces sp. NA02950]QKV94480.1 helix-turn-helix domain-containing protein [Streptomyces sp. NA02950]